MRILIIAALIAGCDKAEPQPTEQRKAVVDDRATKAAEVAEKTRKDAVKAVADAQATVGKLEQELEPMIAKSYAATEAVESAQTEADRVAAKAKLDVIQKEYAERQRRLTLARAALMRAMRAQTQIHDVQPR